MYWLGRKVRNSATIDDVTIPEGWTAVSPWVLHHDPETWRQPERWDPDRFLPRRMRKLPEHAFLPFGIGSFASEFAMMQASLALAVIARKCRWMLVNGSEAEPDLGLLLEPSPHLRFRLYALED